MRARLRRKLLREAELAHDAAHHPPRGGQVDQDRAVRQQHQQAGAEGPEQMLLQSVGIGAALIAPNQGHQESRGREHSQNEKRLAHHGFKDLELPGEGF